MLDIVVCSLVLLFFIGTRRLEKVWFELLEMVGFVFVNLFYSRYLDSAVHVLIKL